MVVTMRDVETEQVVAVVRSIAKVNVVLIFEMMVCYRYNALSKIPHFDS